MPIERMKHKGPDARIFEHHGLEVRLEGKAKRLSFSASSEEAIDRWYGKEVLSHDKDAVNLKRAKRKAMPLLVNHNIDDPVGIITAAEIEEGRLIVDADLFETARSEEIQRWINGGLKNVSIAYRINTIEEDKKKELFTVTNWEPYEVSIVTVPADFSVGLGRAQMEYEVRMVRASTPAAEAATKEAVMPEETKGAATVAVAEKEKAPDITQIERARAQDALELEKERIRGIENLCRANRFDDKYKDYWIGSGLSIAKITDDMLRILEERGKSNPQSVSRLGLSERETNRFSIVRAIKACVEKDWTKNAPFELECSRAIAERLGKVPDPNRFLVPYEVQERANPTPVEDLAYRLMKRDMTVAAAGQGGYLVATSNVGFIELLRNRSVLFNMGAQRLSGLRDSITIPKQTVAATTTWLATEATAITESNQTFVQIALTPKNVGGYTEISRQLLLQSNPAIEGLVTSDLAIVVALDIDLKGLNGSGASGQPTGILNTAGIGAVTGTSLDYADIIEFQTDVFAGNALTGMSGYVTTGVVAGLLKARVKFASTASPIWDGRLEDANVDGYRGMASNQMPAATMLFGDFGSVVVAEWGVLEVEVNPFADFKAGIIGVRAIASIDIGVRYPTAFSVASTIT